MSGKNISQIVQDLHCSAIRLNLMCDLIIVVLILFVLFIIFRAI